MTKKDFWAILNKADWKGAVARGDGDPCQSCGKSLRKLLRTWNDFIEFRDYYDDCCDELMDAVSLVHPSLEYRQDLFAMIIGLGRKEFKKNLKNPKLMGKRANRLAGSTGIVVSFDHCFPLKDSYEHIVDRIVRSKSDQICWMKSFDDYFVEL